MKNFASYGWDGKADRQAEAHLQKYKEKMVAGKVALWQGLALGATEAVRKDLSNDRLESAVAVNIVTKEEIFRRFGDEDETPLQEENRAMIKDPNNTALIHNHWNDSPGSQADFDAALWLGVRYLIVVTPSGTQYIYEREGNTMKLADKIFNREHVALPSPAETAESRAAYAAQALAEIGNPAERVMLQEDELRHLHIDQEFVSLTVEQARQFFRADLERGAAEHNADVDKLSPEAVEERRAAWEDKWTAHPSSWADYKTLSDLLPIIKAAARNWNHSNSGMSDDAVAAILIANLHQESRFQRTGGSLNPILLGGWLQDKFGDMATFLSHSASLGPANLRMTVVDEILGKNGVDPYIPMPNGPGLEFDDEGKLDDLEEEWLSFQPRDNRGRVLFISKDENAIELMGANFYRGVERLSKQPDAEPPTMFNMFAWLSQGVAESNVLVTDDGKAPAARSHAIATLGFAHAIILYAEAFELEFTSGDYRLFNEVDFQAYLRQPSQDTTE